MEEKIDILMATYNGEKYLKEQIDSILSQTYSNFRLLICDDCSTDHTYDIIKEYEKKDSRIVVYKNEVNLGYVKNFEELMKKVTSEYFMLCDQDDVWNSTKIENSILKLKLDNADMIFTDLEVVDENLELKNKSFNKLMGYDRKIKKCINSVDLVYLYNVVTGCTILCKSKFLSNIIPLPENKNFIHDHYITILVYLLGGKVSYLDSSELKYRQHSTNQVGTKRYTSNLNDFEIIRNHLIDVKLSIFSEYIKLNENFDDVRKKENIEVINYFNYLKSVKKVSIKKINIYFKLYKNEKISYKFLYFFIFHFPGICKIGYKIFKIFIKRRN